jgi:hypothetical protein
LQEAIANFPYSRLTTFVQENIMTSELSTRSRIVAGLALATTLGLAGCGSTAPASAVVPAPPGPGRYDQLAIADLTDIAAGNDGPVEAGLAPAMARQLRAPALAQAWQSYQQLFGSYQSHGQPQDIAYNNFAVVNVPLTMTKQPGQFRISFDRTGRIAGLYFLRVGVPVPSS